MAECPGLQPPRPDKGHGTSPKTSQLCSWGVPVPYPSLPRPVSGLHQVVAERRFEGNDPLTYRVFVQLSLWAQAEHRQWLWAAMEK